MNPAVVTRAGLRLHPLRNMASLRQAQLQAANEFAEATIAAVRDPRGVHAETAIAALARMAGTFLFRSFGFEIADLTPGQAVFSEQANEQGPRLLDILGSTLAALDVPLDPKKLTGKVDPERSPRRAFLETQKLLEPRLAPIRDAHGLSLMEAAEAAAAGAALLIRHGVNVLDPHAAFNLAVYAFIEGAKTAPDPVIGPREGDSGA